MKRACAIVLVLLLTLSAVGCTGQNQQQDSVYKTNLMLDTIVQITLYDWEDSSTIDLAFDEIRRLESLLSVEQEGRGNGRRLCCGRCGTVPSRPQALVKG